MTERGGSDGLAWRRLSGERRYDGYTRVRRDAYRLPDGSVSDWDVLEQADTVSVVAFTDGRECIIFDQFRVGPARVLGELPGGLIDPGETPLEAGARELEEETGYRAAALFPAGSEWSGANSTRRKHVVIAAGCRRVGEPAWGPGEMGAVRLLPGGTLVDHLMTGDLSDAGASLRGLHAFVRATPGEAILRDLQPFVRALLASSSRDAAVEQEPFESFWAEVDLGDPVGSRRRLEALLEQSGASGARRAYERASLHDALGEEGAAIPLYREALDGGLGPELRTQATIQLASSLRNVGDASAAIALLQSVPDDDPLRDCARAFLALALDSDGNSTPALRMALQTLAPHLPRYQRAVAAYAADLEPDASSRTVDPVV